MKYFKIVFILFGLFELFATYGTLTSSVTSINAEFGGDYMTSESMHFVRAFGAATLALSIMSFLGVTLKNRAGLIVLITGLLIFNLGAGYGCVVDYDLSTKYKVGLYAHAVFSVLFLVMLVQTLRMKS